MKKLLVLLCFLLVGCSNSAYDNYVKELKNSEASSEIPFDVEFNIDDVNENRIIYQVIIDNPKVDASNVKALVIHDAKTEDIFPSVGIVDETINLNEHKGIILMGYINKTEDINFKVLIETDQKYVYTYNY